MRTMQIQTPHQAKPAHSKPRWNREHAPLPPCVATPAIMARYSTKQLTEWAEMRKRERRELRHAQARAREHGNTAALIFCAKRMRRLTDDINAYTDEVLERAVRQEREAKDRRNKRLRTKKTEGTSHD